MGNKGGGASGTQTTTSTFSPWDQFALKQYQDLVGGLTFGGPGGTETPYPGPYQTVAPFNQEEMAGMGYEMGYIPTMQGTYGAGTNYLMGTLNNPAGYVAAPGFNQPNVSAPGVSSSLGMNPAGMVGTYQNEVLGGEYLNPATNPELNAYAKAATDMQSKIYGATTAPSEMSQAVTSGAFGGSADAEARALNQYNFANAIGNTMADIYEPAYQAERGLQQQTYGTGAQFQETAGGQQLGASEANAANQLAASQANAANALGAYQSQLGYESGQQANLIKELGLLPQTMQAGQIPGETALSIGGIEQAQNQAGINAAYQNAYNTSMWPYQLGSYYGGMATGINQGFGQGTQNVDFPGSNPSFGQSILGGGLAGGSLGYLAGGPTGAGIGAGLGGLLALFQ